MVARIHGLDRARCHAVMRQGDYSLLLVEAPDEDAIFEVLQKSWVVLGIYPTVDPVVDFEGFGQVLQRIRG